MDPKLRQRNMRFRAYDIVKKKIVMNKFNIIGETTMFDLLKQYTIENLNDILVVQYLSLKDKNGKEICEGDILKGPNGYYCEVAWEEYGEEKDCVRSFCFRKLVGKFKELYCDHYLDDANISEIVGNVVENPELLKNE